MENYKTKHLFTIGTFNKNHLILFFFCPLTYALNTQISIHMLKKKIINQTQNYFSIYFGYLIINGIIMLFNIKNIFIIKDFYYKIKMKKIIILFILLLILEYLSTYVLTYFSNFHNFLILFGILSPIQIIPFCFLSKFIFKLEIYKHHYFSIIIICISLLLHNYLNLKDTFKLNYQIIVGSIFLIYIYPLLDMMGHIILYEIGIHLSSFLTLLGILGIIIGMIILVINNYFEINFFNLKFDNVFWNEKGENNIKYLALLSILRGITYTFVWSIFSLFKPWFFEISNVITAFFLFIYLNIINEISEHGFKDIFTLKNIIQIIIFIILIFACLILNEQIICNFWGLNKNTQNNITTRSLMELIDMLNNNKVEDKMDIL